MSRAARRQKARSRGTKAARHRRSRRREGLVLWAVVVVVGGGLIAGVLLTKSKTPSATSAQTDTAKTVVTGPPGPEGVPLETGVPLASAAGAMSGPTVDGISCNPGEQVVYHIHSHLAVFVDGHLRPVPAGIGIVQPQSSGGGFYSASSCYYWLHVHAQDGIIHVESPAEQTYTLGQLFDLWRQPLSRTRVGPASGVVSVFVDGKRYTGDPRRIGLKQHEDIQIDVGSIVPPEKVQWSSSSL